MRVLVCGDRDWEDREMIYIVLSMLPNWSERSTTTIVHGAARGADRMASDVADDLRMANEPYPANWKKYGLSAGPIRNRKMLESGIDLVLAFHDSIDHSKGTKHMVQLATKAGVPVRHYHH